MVKKYFKKKNLSQIFEFLTKVSVIAWLLSIFVFIFSLVIANHFLGNQPIYPKPILTTFLINILVGVAFFVVGILFFFLTFITRLPYFRKKSAKASLINISIPILGIFILLLIIFITKIHPLTLGINKTQQIHPIQFSLPTNTPTPTPTYIPSHVVVAPTVNSDPIITCNSSYPKCVGQSVQVRQSQCQNITCCEIGDKWIVYADKNKCTSDQNAYNANQNNYNPPLPNTQSYYPCTLYYPALHTYQTYSQLYTTQEECDAEQALINSGSTVPSYTQPMYAIPTPTPDPYCATAVINWDTFRNNFMTYTINNYPSSYDGMVALHGYMQQYQQQANNHGCNVTLYM